MKQTVKPRKLSVCGREITYEWACKKVKNINIRVRRDGTVFVSSPRTVKLREIELLLTEKASFLFSALDRVEKQKAENAVSVLSEGGKIFLFGEEKTLHFVNDGTKKIEEKDGFLLVFGAENAEKAKKMLREYAEKQLKLLLFQLSEQALPLFSGVKMPEIRLRLMRATWGNCRAKSGILTFNSRLACYPVFCIEYIVMHEFSHFLFADHSAHFYAALSERMHDWKERKQYLAACKIVPFF